jgi:hypothetical protein
LAVWVVFGRFGPDIDVTILNVIYDILPDSLLILISGDEFVYFVNPFMSCCSVIIMSFNNFELLGWCEIVVFVVWYLRV